MKKNILVIFGGHNTEYYASCDSVGGMLDCLDQELFNILKLGVTIEGNWILTTASSEDIKDGVTWLQNESNRRAILSPERNKKTLMVFDSDGIREIPIDCVFPLISGYGGEDGTLQGLLELTNIPYVGSTVASSANAMDKALTRVFADLCGLKQPDCIILRKSEYEDRSIDLKHAIDFGYPVFVKPASLGSSVGVSKVDDYSELHKAIELAFEYENKILIEQGIEGKEIKVAVLEDAELHCGDICEITVSAGQVNDYKTKHINFTSNKRIPAEIEPEIAEKAKQQSKDIFRIMECRGFARVDFFLTPDNELYFNEINTVPGIAQQSIWSRMFESAGISLKVAMTRLINTSLENRKQVSETNQDVFKQFI